MRSSCHSGRGTLLPGVRSELPFCLNQPTRGKTHGAVKNQPRNPPVHNTINTSEPTGQAGHPHRLPKPTLFRSTLCLLSFIAVGRKPSWMVGFSSCCISYPMCARCIGIAQPGLLDARYLVHRQACPSARPAVRLRKDRYQSIRQSLAQMLEGSQDNTRIIAGR